MNVSIQYDVLGIKIWFQVVANCVSINKFLIVTLNELLKGKESLEYHDMDDLFGTWSEDEFKKVEEVVIESRIITPS